MMAVMGPILGGVPSDAPSRGASSGGVIRSGPSILRRACSAINQASDKLGVTLLTCMAIFAAARYFCDVKEGAP